MIIEKRRGFTLIELLVVIAVIALLMSILVPAMQAVRKQTKSLICQSNLRQWGVMFMMFADDNNGYFMKGFDSPEPGGRTYKNEWLESLSGYLGGVDEILSCPLATRPARPDPAGTEGWFPDPTVENMTWFGNVFVAWGVFPPGVWTSTRAIHGSYGLNEFVNNSAASSLRGVSTDNCWRTYAVKGASKAPMLLDAWWVHGTPSPIEEPPEYETYLEPWNQLTRFCVNRHRGAVNGLFVDFSVRRVGLKELWKLKWHRSFDTSNSWTITGNGGSRAACAAVWDYRSPWMRNMPEY